MSGATTNLRTRVESEVSKLRQVIENHWISYLFFLPTLLLIFIVLWIPFFRGIWMSFHEWPMVGEVTWVGLGNYEYLMEWDIFWISVKATAWYMTSTFLQIAIGVGAALIIANISHLRDILSSAFLVPYTMPPVAAAALWVYLIDPDYGPIFVYLQELGVLEPIYWGVHSSTAIAVITLISSWTFWPFVFLIVLASRESIGDEQYEAARTFGANRFQMFYRITLPQLKSAILIAFSLRFVWNLVKISQPLTLTGGGPGWDTSIVGILLYRLTLRGELGRAYAIGILIFVAALFAIILFLTQYNERGGVEA